MSDPLLQEQSAYYRAVAREYFDHALDVQADLDALIDTFAPRGDVLELACGPGTWTALLARHADTLTAVDGAPEMLALARERMKDAHVRFVEADIFEWRPERRYDAVFFGFWLSHVPLERFEAFWALVADCLKPGGRALFVDDGYRTPEELIEGENSEVIRRRLNDGTGFRIVKVAHTAERLEARLRELG